MGPAPHPHANAAPAANVREAAKAAEEITFLVFIVVLPLRVAPNQRRRFTISGL